MCGIIAHISKGDEYDSTSRILEQFEDQHGRGTEGFGVIHINKDKLKVNRSTHELKTILDVKLGNAPAMMFHHRNPTSTENTIQQTHPIFVSHEELRYDHYVIHNGVIGNHEELYRIHTKEYGYKYTTLTRDVDVGPEFSNGVRHYQKNKAYNDSEALAIELVRYFEGKSDIVGTLGSAAFIILSVDKKTGKPKLMRWGTNGGNPLDFIETKSGILVASRIQNMEAEAITPNTFEVFNLEKYFKLKKQPDLLRTLIERGEMDFLKITPKESPKDVPTRTAPSGTGFATATQKLISSSQGSTRNSTEKTTSGKTKDGSAENEDQDERLYGLSRRHAAFLVMAQRFQADTSNDIEALFEKMAYGPVPEEDINMLCEEIRLRLLSKERIAEERVRPHYDKQEEEELAEAVAEDESKGNLTEAEQEDAINEQTIRDLERDQTTKEINQRDIDFHSIPYPDEEEISRHLALIC